MPDPRLARRFTLEPHSPFIEGRTDFARRLLEHASRAEGSWVETRGIPVLPAALGLPWRGHSLTLIDPFLANARREAVPPGDAALLLLSADEREQDFAAQRRMLQELDASDPRPRMIFIGHIQRREVVFPEFAAEFSRSMPSAAFLQIPIGAGDGLAGLTDLVEMRALYFDAGRMRADAIPAPEQPQAALHRARLLETLRSQELLPPSSAAPSPAEVRAAVARGCAARLIRPVLCGSAYRDVGMPCVLDAIVDYFPGGA